MKSNDYGKWIFDSNESDFRNKIRNGNKRDLDEARKFFNSERDSLKKDMYKNRLDFLNVKLEQKGKKWNHKQQKGGIAWMVVPTVIFMITVLVTIIAFKI